MSGVFQGPYQDKHQVTSSPVTWAVALRAPMSLQITPSQLFHQRDGMSSRGFCDRLEEWTRTNIIKFKKGKYKVQHLAWGSSQYQCRLGDECIESCLMKKKLGMLVDEKLQQPRKTMYSALQRQKHGQQFEGSDPVPILHSLKIPSQVHSALEFLTKERHGPVTEGPEQD